MPRKLEGNNKANKIIVLSKVYFPAFYLSRNDYLIRSSSCLIAYFDGVRKGGTFIHG